MKSEEEIDVKLKAIGPVGLDFSSPAKELYVSALMTRKEEPEKYYEKYDEKRLFSFINGSVRRGHASVGRMEILNFHMAGSRVLDYFFSSYEGSTNLVYSQRILAPNLEKGVLPKNLRMKKVEELCKAQLEIYEVIESILKNDYKDKRSIEKSRRVLGNWTPSHLSYIHSLEGIAGNLKRIEVSDKDFLPDEIVICQKKMEEEINKLEKYEDIKPVYNALKISPTGGDTMKNIFISEKNPSSLLIVKKAEENNFPKDDVLIDEVGIEADLSEYLNTREEGRRKVEELLNRNDLENSYKNYLEYTRKLTYIAEHYRDFYIALMLRPMSLARFNEEKRHTRIAMACESFHSAALRALKNLDKGIEDFIYIPPLPDELKALYVESIYQSLDLYKKLFEDGIKPKDLFYILPQAIKIYCIQKLDLLNFLAPFWYFGIRSCQTAEVEIRESTRKLPNLLKKYSKTKIGKKIGEILEEEKIVSKCAAGICPEEYYCDLIFVNNKSYNKDKHESIHSYLKNFIFYKT